MAIHCFQCQHVLCAQTGDRPGNISLATSTLAKLAGNIGCELGISRLFHQPEGFLDIAIGRNVKEGRLVKRDTQRGFERVVENRIARTVGEISEDDGVFVGQKLALLTRTIIKSARDETG